MKPGDNVAEWLRRQPAKLMGFARVGSNPTVVDIFVLSCWNGGVAQMVERMLSMHEAQGSIPCSSTFFFDRFVGSFCHLFKLLCS